MHAGESGSSSRGEASVEGDERIDVLVARQASTKDGIVLRFDDAWTRRQTNPYSETVSLAHAPPACAHLFGGGIDRMLVC